MIDAAFGGYDNFRKELSATTVSQFGSGWGWLVVDGGTLKVVKTANAEVPFTKGQKPPPTIDVWEHAYYLSPEQARRLRRCRDRQIAQWVAPRAERRSVARRRGPRTLRHGATTGIPGRCAFVDRGRLVGAWPSEHNGRRAFQRHNMPIDGPFFQAARQEARGAQAERQAGAGRSRCAHARSARDVAVQAQGPRRPRSEPAADFSMTGASLIEWSPVAQRVDRGRAGEPWPVRGPQNAALLYGSGQAQPARDLQACRKTPMPSRAARVARAL